MKRTIAITLMLFLAGACTREQAQHAKEKVAEKAAKVHDVFDADGPADGKEPADAAQRREQQRFDQKWRDLQSFRAAEAAKQQPQPATATTPPATPENPEQTIQFAANKKESFKGLDVNAINNAPVVVPVTGDVRGPSVLKAQVYLDRLHYSVGVLDGRWGRNSAITVWWWQRMHGIQPTGDVDENTFKAIARAAGYAPAIVPYTIAADDTKGPFTPLPDSPYEKAKLSCLCYESLKEELAERFHSTEDFLELLNPDVKLNDLQAGATINVPNVRPPVTADAHDIAKVVISVTGNSWNGFDAAGNIVFHAPTTLGSTFDPSPDEAVKVVKIVPLPHFHYDPTLYADVPDDEPDAHLNPGPNSPVGVVWMALSKPHYGMHGTPAPETIGYASSHGCVRLSNWDADEVRHRIAEGTVVNFVDTSRQGMPEVTKKD
jgi:lipoprotein-anchoring transpeptidase ErfK/SrfK